jgi:hyperosmotically inducible protein
MTSRARRFITFACAALASASIVVACERPGGQVISSAAETHSRNAAPPLRASEPPRDADAAGRSPTPAPAALPARESISDAVITARIRASILADAGMSGADVSVNTDRGVVILAGEVKSYEQAAIASAYAQRPDGVMRVDNQLTLAAR